MKVKRHYFLKKRILLLPLLLLLIPIIFLAYVYFSPGQVRYFRLGNQLAEINLYGGNINIYYPKGDGGYYHFHNLSWPQEIAGTGNNKNKQNTIPSDSIKQITEQIQQHLPQTEQKFMSKLLDLTLVIPKGFNLKVNRQINTEKIDIIKDDENRMTLMIFPVANGCKDTDYSSGRWDPLRIKIAGKYPVTFTHSSISHGDSGHSYGAQALANNDYCINISMNISIQNQKEFTNILEGK